MGLKLFSQMAANFTLDPDTIAALTNLKAKYDSFNQKRAEKGLTERGLRHWLKMMFEAPGLKARSAIPLSVSPIRHGEKKKQC